MSYPYDQWTSDTVPDSLLNPPSGVYAISANNLQGLRFKNRDLYATFRQRKPDAIVGHSIFIYRINRTVRTRKLPGATPERPDESAIPYPQSKARHFL